MAVTCTQKSQCVETKVIHHKQKSDNATA